MSMSTFSEQFDKVSCFTPVCVPHLNIYQHTVDDSLPNQFALDTFYDKPNKIISCFERFRPSHVRRCFETRDAFTLPNRIIGCSISNHDVNKDFPSCDEMDAFIQDDRVVHFKGFGDYIKSTQVQTSYMALPTIIKIE